jgi:hypothetical protein
MPYMAKTASFLVSDTPSFNVAFPVKDNQPMAYSDHDAYPASRNASASGSDVDDGERMSAGSSSYAPLGPRTEYQAHHWPPKSSLPPLPKTHTSTSGLSVVGRSQFEPNVVLAPPHVEPWLHPAFAPLPSAITNYLTQTANAIEMPARHAFDDALARFLNDLSAELKATAALAPDPYADLCKAVAAGDTSALGQRLHMWATFHHLRAGSKKMHLLVLLRDDKYGIGAEEEEHRRAELALRVDHQWYGKTGEKYADTVPEISDTFERFPVQQQIFDILVYAHRNHGAAAAMLDEARAVGMVSDFCLSIFAGGSMDLTWAAYIQASITWPMAEMFVRLCPLCNLRAKSAASPLAGSSTPGTSSNGSFTSSYNIPPSGTKQYPARF